MKGGEPDTTIHRKVTTDHGEHTGARGRYVLDEDFAPEPLRRGEEAAEIRSLRGGTKHVDKRTQGTAPVDDTRAILDSIADGVFTVDTSWRVTSFNRAAEAITHIARERRRRDEAVRRGCQEAGGAAVGPGSRRARRS